MNRNNFVFGQWLNQWSQREVFDGHLVCTHTHLRLTYNTKRIILLQSRPSQPRAPWNEWPLRMGPPSDPHSADSLLYRLSLESSMVVGSLTITAGRLFYWLGSEKTGGRPYKVAMARALIQTLLNETFSYRLFDIGKTFFIFRTTIAGHNNNICPVRGLSSSGSHSLFWFRTNPKKWYSVVGKSVDVSQQLPHTHQNGHWEGGPLVWAASERRNFLFRK